MIILKLKKKFFTAKKVLFLEDVDTEKVLVSKKISSGEKKKKQKTKKNINTFWVTWIISHYKYSASKN